MADSIFASLLNMLDPRDLRAIGNAAGESEQSVSRGMQSSIAAVLGSIAGIAGDPTMLRKTLDLLPNGSTNITWPNLVEGATDPESPLIATGKRMLASLFGSSAGTVLDAISRDSGLRSGVASTLMAVAAPFVLSYLNRRVRTEGLTMSALGSLLERDSGAIRNALPGGLIDVIWPRAAATAAPVAAPAARVERRTSWAAPLALAALALGGFWLLHQARRTTPVMNNPMHTGTASRSVDENVRSRSIPEEAKTPAPSETTKQSIGGADLRYRTGSSELRPESKAQLEQLATQLAGSPDTHAKVSGFTDSVGNADRNLRLSQKRADKVMAYLVGKGVAKDRVTAEGYGEENPVASNDTANGRAQNRRVMVSVE